MVVSGNPRVTPDVTRDVCLLARLMAANLYFAQIEDLMFEVENSSFFPDTNSLNIPSCRLLGRMSLGAYEIDFSCALCSSQCGGALTSSRQE